MGPKAVYFGETPCLGANLKIRPYGKLLPNYYFPNRLFPLYVLFQRIISQILILFN